VEHLRCSLEAEGIRNIRFVTRLELRQEAWKKDTFLLIMPGGRDIPYQSALQGTPNEHIRSFVEEGGRYLGLCAGAYYASGRIEFEKGTSLEVVVDRDLKFFPGLALGPAYGPNLFRYHEANGAKVASLVLATGCSKAFFDGGPAFMDAHLYPNVDILARYEDIQGQPPAIILCRVGQGIALLSGVHPCYCFKEPVKDRFLQKLVPELEKIEPIRRELFRECLRNVELVS
jgi:biotin--protein ligase